MSNPMEAAAAALTSIAKNLPVAVQAITTRVDAFGALGNDLSDRGRILSDGVHRLASGAERLGSLPALVAQAAPYIAERERAWFALAERYCRDPDIDTAVNAVLTVLGPSELADALRVEFSERDGHHGQALDRLAEKDPEIRDLKAAEVARPMVASARRFPDNPMEPVGSVTLPVDADEFVVECEDWSVNGYRSEAPGLSDPEAGVAEADPRVVVKVKRWDDEEPVTISMLTIEAQALGERLVALAAPRRECNAARPRHICEYCGFDPENDLTDVEVADIERRLDEYLRRRNANGVPL